MSTTAQERAEGLSTDHSRARADGAHSHGVIAATSRASRFTSFDVADFPEPTGREEEWRFTPVDRLGTLMVADLPPATDVIDVMAAPDVSVEVVPRGDPRLPRIGVPGDRAAAASFSAATEAQLVTIPRGVTASRDTHLVVTGSGQVGAGRVVVVAEELSDGVVILDHRGEGFLNQTVEIDVRDGAHLTMVSVQDWAEGSLHLSAHRASVGRDATLTHIVVTLGGSVVRVTPEAGFAGPGGDLAMFGLYFADAGQHQEHRLFVDHAVPNCRSRVAYKGALQGAGARTVWVGDALIRATADGTDTYELNRNLVLSDGARADSVPNLEIETGNIEGAGHASATGRFDDEQLFYLRARGIPEEVARRLVVRGFFAELIAKIGVPEVEKRLMDAIEVELAKAAA